MKWIIILGIFSLLLVPFVFAEENYVKGQLLVLVKEGYNSNYIINKLSNINSGVISIGKEYNGEFEISENSKLRRFYIINFRDSVDLERMKQKLSKERYVEIVDYNHIFKLQNAPNDPDLNLQWGLTKIKMEDTYDLEMGDSSTVIAVLDTGADLDHPDLQSNLLPGYDFVNNDNDPNDIDGHGTHVTGIAGAITNNHIGVASVCSECSLLPVRVCNGTTCLTTNIFKGIEYSIDNHPVGGIPDNSNVADIISMSFSSLEDNFFVRTGIQDAYSEGKILVAAAGNQNNDVPTYPAYYNEVIAVAATDEYDLKYTGSNYGSWVDVCAPGVSIYSTYYFNGYSYKSGTSVAAPHVSGLAGLILSSNPNFTNEEARAIIEDTADNIDALNNGYAGLLGAGRINALNALRSFCSNGVYSGECVDPGNSPQYCLDHYIIANCQECGCPQGTICYNNGVCGEPIVNTGAGGSPLMKKLGNDGQLCNYGEDCENMF